MTDRTPTSDPVAAAWTQLWTDLFRDHQSWHTTFEEHRPLIEEAIRQQARAAFAAKREAALAVVDEYDKTHLTHDVAYEDVAAAIDQLRLVTEGRDHPDLLPRYRALLAAHPEPASPEAPGSGLDVEHLTAAFHAESCSPHGHPVEYDRPLIEKVVATYDRLAARPDGAEADAS